MKKTGDDPAHRAFGKALRLLALRDHSCREMRTKLAERGYPEEVIAGTIKRLIELDYLNDGAFAVRWARHLACDKLDGNRRIEAGLFAKGIEKDLIAFAVSEAAAELDEKERLEKLIAKKTKGRLLENLDPDERQKLARALFRKGYPQRLIYDQLGKSTEEFIYEGQ
jgi:regulatory protein